MVFISVPILLSLTLSSALANPAGETIPVAVSVDVPPQGFSGLATAVTELTLETVTLDDFYEDNGCGFTDTSFGIENF